MKTLTIGHTVPRHLSHVHTYGMILCVICKQVCNRTFPCQCHRAPRTQEKDE